MPDIILSPDPRPLGKSGISVSPIAWGNWRFAGIDTQGAHALVEAVLAAGVTLFDTADIYGFTGADGFGDAETLLGDVFAAAPGLRDRLVLATKGGIAPPVPYDSGRDHLMAALEHSLRRLRVDHVDLYQIHRPDILAHPQEVARTLDAMVASGKVRAVGVSNYTVEQTRALGRFLSVPLATIQPEFSALCLDPVTTGLLDHAMAEDIAILAWSPLGGGRIAEPGTAQERAVAAALDVKADAAGIDRATAAYAWIMAHPANVIPIVGTQDIDRIGRIADVFTVRWTKAEWYAVLVAARGEKLP